jgi:hypothetical protein
VRSGERIYPYEPRSLGGFVGAFRRRQTVGAAVSV